MNVPEATVSVVTPCYNGAALLPQTLESAVAQTKPPLEILVIDDGSTDDSAAIAESFGPPVRVMRQENRGESVARNRGIDEARGDWIAFLDADDLWKPTKLQRQLEVAGPGVTCVHTNFFYFGTAEGRNDVSKVPPRTRYRVEYVAASNPFRISSLMVHRSLPIRFPEWTQWAEDLIYFLDLSLEADIRLAQEYLTGYRVHPGGQSANPQTAVLRYRAIEQWMDQRSDRLDDGTVRKIRDGSLALMVDMATLAKYQRDWEQYWAIRRFFSEHPEHPAATPLLNERILPKWTYAVKDVLDKWRDKIVAKPTRKP